MSSKLFIDINCDVGEGVGNESQLMPYISSCNIACNEHAGSIIIIDQIIALAKQYQVKVGAHPSFPDRKNFGRKIMQISDKKLQESIEHQINLLIQRASLQEVNLHHVKPHGALYNLIAKDFKTAKIVIKAIKNTFPNAYLYVPFNSVIAEVALQNNLKIKYEVFADRNYNDDLSLVSRTQENALITDKDKVLKHVLNMIIHKKIITLSDEKNIVADTICIHSDTKNAVALIKYLYAKLLNFIR